MYIYVYVCVYIYIYSPQLVHCTLGVCFSGWQMSLPRLPFLPIHKRDLFSMTQSNSKLILDLFFFLFFSFLLYLSYLTLKRNNKTKIWPWPKTWVYKPQPWNHDGEPSNEKSSLVESPFDDLYPLIPTTSLPPCPRCPLTQEVPCALAHTPQDPQPGCPANLFAPPLI